MWAISTLRMWAATDSPPTSAGYPNERLMQSMDTAEQVAALMDDLGFYALWMAEHHFQREGYERYRTSF